MTLACVGKDASRTLQEFKDTSLKLRRRILDAGVEDELHRLLPRDPRERVAFSTQLVNQRFVVSLEELYERAAEVLPTFKQKVKSLAGEVGATALVPAVKGMERARSKAEIKDRSDEGFSWYRLTDPVRDTPEVDVRPDM